ncbi:peptidoglycan-associated lipoprotein Pal [Leptothrix ochracea]|uniref:peptidoglycan-associated lipoprotein Pal n=1 Tax=Leptothrix ochracea TaxID=735331 RepID=UPI0034E1CB4F
MKYTTRILTPLMALCLTACGTMPWDDEVSPETPPVQEPLSTPVAKVDAPAPPEVPELRVPVASNAAPTLQVPEADAPVVPVKQQVAAPVLAKIPAHLDPQSQIITERSVFFDFDRFAVKSDFSAVVERHGRYLASNPPVRGVRIEGHTDERGSTEYNLALGQKRAQTIAAALKSYGVQDGQVDVFSYGEEKPKVKGHNEAAWSQNRRVDILYPTR